MSSDFVQRWTRETDAYVIGISGRAVLRAGLQMRLDASRHIAGNRQFSGTEWTHPRRRPHQCNFIAQSTHLPHPQEDA